MDPLDAVVRKLRSVEGVMDVWQLDAADKKTILQLEEKASESAGLMGLAIVNEGAKLALERNFVFCINHSPTLRHPPKPILVLTTDKDIVGREAMEARRDHEISSRSQHNIPRQGFRPLPGQAERCKGKATQIRVRTARFP